MTMNKGADLSAEINSHGYPLDWSELSEDYDADTDAQTFQARRTEFVRDLRSGEFRQIRGTEFGKVDNQRECCAMGVLLYTRARLEGSGQLKMCTDPEMWLGIPAGEADIVEWNDVEKWDFEEIAQQIEAV